MADQIADISVDQKKNYKKNFQFVLASIKTHDILSMPTLLSDYLIH